MKNFRKLLAPLLIALAYFGGVFLQGLHEPPLSVDCFEGAIRVSNSRGLWQKLTPAQVIELAQTLADYIAEDIGLQPITVEAHDFGAGSNTHMSWNRHTRVVRVNLDNVGLSPHRFIRTLGHEILGHAVQDALIAGEDIAVSMPEQVVAAWRDNMLNYIRPPAVHEYFVSNAAARRQFIAYRNQDVEVHATRAGAEFRRQTRRIIWRVPDDIEFRFIFVCAMVALGAVLLNAGKSDPDLSFEQCVRLIYNMPEGARAARSHSLPILENLHKILSAELGMEPLPVYMPRSSKKRTYYDRVVFSRACLADPEHIIAEVAGETWRACNYSFGKRKPAAMLEYIGEIISRAEQTLGRIL